MSLEAAKTSHQSEVMQLERLETVAMQTYPFKLFRRLFQVQQERDELYRKFVKAIHEVQQKSNFKNLLLEKKLNALADTLEKKEAQLNEVLSASNLDPTALTVVTRKLRMWRLMKVRKQLTLFCTCPWSFLKNVNFYNKL